MAITRDLGNDTKGRQINSRGTAEEEFPPITGIDGGGWKSAPAHAMFLALREGIVPHLAISSFEVYEILMGINREQTPGKMEIRIGASGNWEITYSALSIITSTSECVVGNLGGEQALLEMVRIQGEIADPTFGYLRGSSVEYRRADTALRNGLIGRDVNNIVYVGRLGRSEIEMSFM